jgi:NADH-quinone oxidoreductase subunit L
MDMYSQSAWLIPLFPLIAFLIAIAVGKQMKEVSIYVSILAALASFVLSVLVLIERLNGPSTDYTWDLWEWLNIGEFSIRMGFEINNLNALMLVIVSLVSLLVNLYSKGYMHGDERISVFFGYVALFTFAMLGLVISVNMLQLYIFWELVGLGSFLLIGFWYYKPEAKAAAKKAFIMTRIGDLGLLIAILLLFWYMPGHALDFSSIHNAFADGKIDGGLATAIAILIFIGAVGKSGQFPLHTWLPDAMEGPTPISALIHAATMVAAGVYLVARTFDIFTASPVAMDVVAYVGAFTAIFAATIGIAQNDIKRILAYSTVSQLGYMMLALGIGAYTAGIFHLFTHAFFKALLFLGAGSVIHAVHTQDINEMGGLGKKMKITTWTFAIGFLALSGIPPFSGFWSKDAILAAAYDGGHHFLFVIGLVAAFFTAFYMARLFFLVFAGKPRGDQSHAHESPAVMTIPLIVLAVLAALVGFFETPFFTGFGDWLTGTHAAEHHGGTIVMILSTLVGVLGIGLGYFMYAKGAIPRDIVSGKVPWLTQLLNRKYYIDELYQTVIVKPLALFGLVLNLFDLYVVDGLVKLTAGTVSGIGRVGSRMQNGQLQSYGLMMLLGVIILAVVLVGRRFLNVG